MQGSVLVIGGGIAGMQTSLDLTELGLKVYLVERTPSIGGRMSQLDKTFPTNDCSLCILAPKMVEVFRNPNIELMTYHEVKKVSGKPGNFNITILKKPRYIDETKCKGCGDCAAKCPKIEVPNIFDMNLGKRKSIYIPFPQAVPPIYLIDPELCLYLNKGVCGVCAKICKAEAINFEQKAQEIKINVGAIVVATGFDMFGEELSSRWGYQYKNIVNALEYERILCASGPFGGHVMRPSDEKEPKKIAFVQCAGSRDMRENVPYCSSVCCMYTAKEAIITKEHSDNSECFVFRHDIRAYGKNFYQFTQRAQEEYGVKYFQTKINKIVEDGETNDLIIHYEDLKTGKFNDFKANLVVLATPLVPSNGTKELSEILGIELDNYNFFKEKSYYNKLLSSREGIFLCGFCQGPMDIPETVADASGVASEVATLLSSVKYSQVKEKEIMEEKEVKITDDPRIGVLVCHCGINIGKYVDVPKVVEYIRTLPNVTHCEDNMYSCSSDSQARIKELINEHDLNRFIVASCSPRTHESLFQETCQEAGLNKYLFEMVNIRDQCSWVHMTEKEAATEKAKDLIRMAVAKARLIKPQKEYKLDVIPTALIIGGGVSGMTASLNLADQGFKTYLIEKEKILGGNLNNLNVLYLVQEDASIFLKEIIEKVKKNKNIQIFLSSKMKDVKGYIGNYNVSIMDSKNEQIDLKIGTIIVATGGQELKPKGLFLYNGKNKNIVTQLELEQKLQDKNISWLEKIKRVTFILCVNARQKEGITYCSNICCSITIKNINILKGLKSDLEIVALYRDFQMAKKEFEEYYRERRKDAIFLRYDLDKMPEITKKSINPEKYEIKVFDTNLQENIDFETDLIVLATPMIPADNLEELAKMLKVPLDNNGFFLEAHVKLRPLDFATDGIFLCGCAQWPKNIQDSIAQANGAAGRASRFLSAKEITTSGLIGEVNQDICIGCGKCEEVCPYNAIELTEIIKEFEDIEMIIKKSSINSALCKGCGTCAATCPIGAISVKHYDFNQIGAMIDSLLLEKVKN
ncbi:MAG: FAD-dependent oxidoreductase [Promethearchaeota archaeon]